MSNESLHTEADIAIEKLVLTRLAYMNAMITGTISGIICGSVIFIATIFLIVKGGDVVGPHLALLGEFFIGYKVSFVGSLVGFGYGFATGFAAGYLFSNLYNWIAKFRELRAKSS